MNKNLDHTMKFDLEKEKDMDSKDIILHVYKALDEKGYNPNNQIIGYILSGDPTYITSHNNARTIIRKLDRDELLEEILKKYLEDKI